MGEGFQKNKQLNFFLSLLILIIIILNKYREHILRNIINTFGYKTNRKIVVFESDDWGSIRMPSKLAYSNLLKKGIGVDKSLYDTLDSLEKKEDLEAFQKKHTNNKLNGKEF